MKTNLDKMYKTSSECETNGVWFEFANGISFHVKRFGGDNSKQIEKARMKHFKPYAFLIEQGSLPTEKEKELAARFFVESCLLGWKGVVIDGNEQAFENEIAVKLFTSLPELLNDLMKLATDVSNFKEEYRESLGNS